MDPVRLGVIGCGNISQMNVPGYIRHPRCEVYALCDSNRPKAFDRADRLSIQPRIYTDFHDVLDD